MGIEPSGPLHLGSLITLMSAMFALQGSGKGVLEVTVTDYDYNFQRPRTFPSYAIKPDPAGCHELMSDHTYAEIKRTIDRIRYFFQVHDERPDCSVGSRFRVKRFSEFASHPLFQQIIRKLFTEDWGRKLLKETIMVGGDHNPVILLAPVCSECDHVSVKYRRIRRDGEDSYVQGRCENTKCESADFSVRFDEPGRLNYHYLLDAVRDLISLPDIFPIDGALRHLYPEDPKDRPKPVDLHVFGGDYGVPYGDRDGVTREATGPSKADRIMALLQGISERYAAAHGVELQVPEFYVGPLITSGGHKLSKSDHVIRASVDTVSRADPNWAANLHTCLICETGEKKLDVVDLREYLPRLETLV